MATNSFSGYGTFNPNAVDPYPIETTLAQAGYGQYPAEAQTQLDYYQMERQRNANLYGQELSAQHEQFRQNLQQQMYEQNIKGLTELAKSPGGLQLAAASPYYQGILGGADPETIAAVIGQQREAQSATDYEHGASGLKSAVEAGAVIPDTSNVPGMRIMGTVPVGDPVSIRSALIAANARLGAAGIAARAAQNQAMMPQAHVVIGQDALGRDIPTTVPLPPGVAPMTTLQLWLQVQDQMRQQNASGNAPPTPQQPVIPPPVGKKQTITGPPNVGTGSTGTNLTTAKTDTGGKVGPSNFQTIPPGSPEGRQLQAKAMQFIDQVQRANPQLAGFMKSRGPVIDVRRDPRNGQPVIVGNDGNAYAF